MGAPAGRLMSSIGEGLERVRSELRAAAERAGREPASVRLIAVSKTHPAEAVAEAYAAGQRDFGENYVQELTAKAEALAHLSDLRWHLIGHLQRNKARHVVKVVSAVHTLDTRELASELARRLPPEAPRLPVLVEINLANEPQKHGVRGEALEPLLDAIEREPRLLLSGLMCVPPVSDSPERTRGYFEALRALRDAHGGASRLPELSMGMSSDFELAIAAGSTAVRVGTAIFGARPLKVG